MKQNVGEFKIDALAGNASTNTSTKEASGLLALALICSSG